jgi:hypothetical protein
MAWPRDQSAQPPRRQRMCVGSGYVDAGLMARDLQTAQRVIEAQQRQRVLLEMQVRRQDIELRRLRKALALLNMRLQTARSANDAAA